MDSITCGRSLSKLYASDGSDLIAKGQPEADVVYLTFDPGQLVQLIEQNEQYFILFAVESHPCSSSINAELETSKLSREPVDTLPLLIVRYQFGMFSSAIAEFKRCLPEIVPSKDPVLVLMRGKDEISRHWVCADRSIRVTAAQLLGTHLQNAIGDRCFSEPPIDELSNPMKS